MTAIQNDPMTSNGIQDLEENLSRMAADHVLLQISIHRWTGRVQVGDLDMSASNAEGVKTPVDKKMTTNSAWKLDRHPLFKKIDKIARDIQVLRNRFSVPIKGDGSCIVPASSCGEMLYEIMSLRDQRRHLARMLANCWESEVLPDIQEHIPDHFHQVRGHLASMVRIYHADGVIEDRTESFINRFDITWHPPIPLIGMSGADIDVSSLDHVAGDQVIESLRQRRAEQVAEMQSAMYEEVFGSLQGHLHKMLTASEDPETGETQSELDSGKKRHKTYFDDLMAMLERVERFSHLAPAGFVAQVEQARRLLQGTDPTRLRTSSVIRDRVRAALSPIASATSEIRASRRATL